MRYFFLLLIISLTGCSSNGAKQYPNLLDKNLTLNLNTGSATSRKSNMDFYVGISNIARDCSGTFEGEIKLMTGSNKIGLASGKRIYLNIVAIDRGNFIGRNAGNTLRSGLLFAPEVGKQYEITVNYIDDMWEQKFVEIHAGKRKLLPIISIAACKPV